MPSVYGRVTPKTLNPNLEQLKISQPHARAVHHSRWRPGCPFDHPCQTHKKLKDYSNYVRYCITLYYIVSYYIIYIILYYNIIYLLCKYVSLPCFLFPCSKDYCLTKRCSAIRVDSHSGGSHFVGAVDYPLPYESLDPPLAPP